MSWGVNNYCPQRCDGEDKESLATHRLTVLQEARVIMTQRNQEKLSFAMDRLFPERRKEKKERQWHSTSDNNINPAVFDMIDTICLMLNKTS